jgi:5-methylthioribose kinase
MALETPAGYEPLSESTLPAYLAGKPAAAAALGGGPEAWRVKEVGDGNLNLVFLVEGPAGGLCVKQSLPYVRLVGEGWPMPLSRAFFEYRCLREHARHAGNRLARLYHYDERMYAIVMERLSPHVIMRRAMIEARRLPRFAEHMADFTARTLFFTSDLAMGAPEKKAMTALFCGNAALCKITEDLIFTEPYMSCERNRWTAPQLDAIAAEFRADSELKLAVSRLKNKFLHSAEALIHGDLHTGSIMVTEDDTRVIDAEFAFVGPMGFDLGAIVGNLLLNYFAQDGHATARDPREDYQDWVLAAMEEFWHRFERNFVGLWRREAQGDAYPRALFDDEASRAALEAERHTYMSRLFADTLGFAGAKMIRRILGLAHNIDLEWIEDPDKRALCETRCLRFAREIMVETPRYPGIADVAAGARRARAR